MVQASIKLTFEEYLKYDDRTDTRYELEDGKLIPMPPASPLHSDITEFLNRQFFAEKERLALNWVVKSDVGIRTQIARSRLPDILVIEIDIWRRIRGRSQAIVENLPVLLAVEIVSPGSENRKRDYEDKVVEYSQCQVSEYWIVDPIAEQITLSILTNGNYHERVYRGDAAIVSPTFPELSLSATEILHPPIN